MDPTFRKHFYDEHCAVVGDDAERKELENLRQMKREEAEKLKQEKREWAEKLRQENKEARQQSKREGIQGDHGGLTLCLDDSNLICSYVCPGLGKIHSKFN